MVWKIDKYLPGVYTRSTLGGYFTFAGGVSGMENGCSHIRTCVAEDIRAGWDETIDELVHTLQKLMK